MRRVLGVALVALALGGSSGDILAQAPQPTSEARRITITWDGAPIRDVLMAFSAVSGKSIVAGPAVTGTVTASIVNRPWDVALQAILRTHGLHAVEEESGIIRVDDLASVGSREVIEPIVTRAYRISFVTAAEVQAALAPLLTERGSISVSPSTNTVVVSDIARVHVAIAGVLDPPAG